MKPFLVIRFKQNNRINPTSEKRGLTLLFDND